MRNTEEYSSKPNLTGKHDPEQSSVPDDEFKYRLRGNGVLSQPPLEAGSTDHEVEECEEEDGDF